MEETRVLPEVVRSGLHVFRSACGPELVRSGSSSERGRIDSARFGTAAARASALFQWLRLTGGGPK